MKRTWAIVAATVVVLLGVAVVGAGWGDTDDEARWGRHAGSMSMLGGAGGHGHASHHSSPPSNEADYLLEMVAHHREAVRAATELRRSERPAMRAFGRQVVRTQSAQVDQMEEWLATWWPDAHADQAYEPMMRDLDDLSGDALDRTFLEDMVPHHMAAVMISQQLLARGLAEHPAVEGLARRIRVEQMDEIRWMRATWSRMDP